MERLDLDARARTLSTPPPIHLAYFFTFKFELVCPSHLSGVSPAGRAHLRAAPKLQGRRALKNARPRTGAESGAGQGARGRELLQGAS
eukprot:6212167-Pleurochrysis_carterae.AAC.3